MCFLALFPSAWLAKAALELAQDLMRVDGVMAQQYKRVEPQVCHLIDDLSRAAVLGS